MVDRSQEPPPGPGNAERQEDPPPSPYDPLRRDEAMLTGAETPTLPPGSEGAPRRGGLSGPLANWQSILVPLLAILTAFVIGGLIIWSTTGDFGKVTGAFGGLIHGSLGTPQNIANTLIKATPFIFAGLAVALAFQCGLFNIGAEGQIALGALFASFVGYNFKDLPGFIHLPLALLAGMLGGFIWGALPGALKVGAGRPVVLGIILVVVTWLATHALFAASTWPFLIQIGLALLVGVVGAVLWGLRFGFIDAKTSAHEVITTIMLNYLALQFVTLMLSGPMKDPSPTVVAAQTPKIPASAWMPMLIPSLNLHSGVLLAVIVAFLVWFFLWRTTWGFEIRTVGANQFAARYAGMPVVRNTVLALALSGMLAGLGGADEVLGVNLFGTRYFALGFSSGYGFDSIAVALLARNSPFGVIIASLLFGALRAGSREMQSNSQVPSDIISVIQALVLLFVAADQIVRWIYRVRQSKGSGPTPRITGNWSGEAAS